MKEVFPKIKKYPIKLWIVQIQSKINNKCFMCLLLSLWFESIKDMIFHSGFIKLLELVFHISFLPFSVCRATFKPLTLILSFSLNISFWMSVLPSSVRICSLLLKGSNVSKTITESSLQNILVTNVKWPTFWGTTSSPHFLAFLTLSKSFRAKILFLFDYINK